MWLLAFLWIAISAGWSADSARAQSTQLAKSDLAFHFVCQQTIRSELEVSIEKFLRHEGFKVLNQARILREHGIFAYDIYIFGLDDKRRIFTFSALPRSEGRYSAGLITPPPTQRSLELEDAVLKLISGQLGCELRQITRSENQADAKEIYELHYRTIEKLFEQAERLEGRGRL
jgi:hypothetical protein